MAEFSLIELDSLDLLTIIDNDLDPISKTYVEGLSAYGNLGDIVMDSPHRPQDRGGLSVHEVRMDQICQGAHGLSILLVSWSSCSGRVANGGWCRLGAKTGRRGVYFLMRGLRKRYLREMLRGCGRWRNWGRWRLYICLIGTGTTRVCSVSLICS